MTHAHPSVSDEHPTGEDPKGLSAQHASAVPERQTPLPSPSPLLSDTGVEEIASSLAQMVTEYVEGGINSNQNWRNGLDAVIERRLQRLLAPRLTSLQDALAEARKERNAAVKVACLNIEKLTFFARELGTPAILHLERDDVERIAIQLGNRLRTAESELLTLKEKAKELESELTHKIALTVSEIRARTEADRKAQSSQAREEALRAALEEIAATCERSALDVGFVHGEPTRKELQERLNAIKAITLSSLKTEEDKNTALKETSHVE